MLRFSAGREGGPNENAGEVEEYKAHRSKAIGKRTARQIKPATVNRELACLKAMFFHAIKNHPELQNPVSAVEFLERTTSNIEF
jgi:site-specific recombinase XerD